MPWCSIILPTLNEEVALPLTLPHLHPLLASGEVEVIVADGGSRDRTCAIARSFGCRVITCPPGRAHQMNAGAACAGAPHLWFLHADTRPPGNWVGQLRIAARNGTPATFPLRFDYRHPLSPLRLYGWLSAIDLDAFRFGDQTLFVSAAAFRSVGGFDERMALLEDNDIVRRLRRTCGSIQLLEGRVLTSARKYRKYGVVFTQAVYVMLYLGYRLGVGGERLLAFYRRAFRDENGDYA